MTSCPEAPKILEFEKKKKRVSWDSSLEEGSRFLISPRRDQLGFTKCVARGGVRWKSQHRKKSCFSFLMSKNLKLKKVNKSFVPEPISSVFRIPIYLWTFVNVFRIDMNMSISRIRRLWLCNRATPPDGDLWCSEHCVTEQVVWRCLVSLFNGLSTFVGYLMPNPFS